MNCYLYMIANYADVTYNHKYTVVNAWAIISVFWEKFSCAFPSNLSDELRFEWRTEIWVKSNHHSNLSEAVWYPPDLSEPSNLSDHPELRESRLDHPELSASPIFESGHLPDNLDLWILKFERDLDLWPHTWPWPWIFMVKLWNSCISEWEGRLTLYKGVAVGHSCPFGDQVRCMDLPDSDRGDFSCRRTVDSSSWFR